MTNKTGIGAWVFFITFLSVYYMIDFVEPSIATQEKSLTQEVYSKANYKSTQFSGTIKARSSLKRRRSIREKRRSILEQVDTGQEDVCADILGPEWNTNDKPESKCPKLDVWVPKKIGFTEFVKVNEKSELEGGFSIAVFCHALQKLPFRVQPIFKPFVNDKGESSGDYDQILEHIADQHCQAVAGDMTIRGNRARYVDFTVPYLSSEVYMVVSGLHERNQTLWTLLKPFTWRLWITVIGTCVFIGVAVSFLEYRVGNPKFSTPLYSKLIMVIWFPISTFFFQEEYRVGNPKFSTPLYSKLIMVIWFPISTFFFQEGKVVNKCSKVVLVMWLSMIFIVVQIFTATLSSWLTLDQLRPKVPLSFENAGYQGGSFLKDLIMDHYNIRSGDKLVSLNSIEEYKMALSNGSVNAIFDELPYVELFLAKYGSDYMKSGPINQESGIAFAFPRGDPLLQDFSRAVINVTESDVMMKLKEKYLGFSTLNTSQSNQPLPQSLDVQSFIGLFIFMGTVTIVAIISSEISLMRGNNKVLPIISTDN